jgi:hypothetical protein
MSSLVFKPFPSFLTMQNQQLQATAKSAALKLPRSRAKIDYTIDLKRRSIDS